MPKKEVLFNRNVSVRLSPDQYEFLKPAVSQSIRQLIDEKICRTAKQDRRNTPDSVF